MLRKSNSYYMQSDFCKQNQLAYKMILVFYAYNKKAVSKKPFETAIKPRYHSNCISEICHLFGLHQALCFYAAITGGAYRCGIIVQSQRTSKTLCVFSVMALAKWIYANGYIRMQASEISTCINPLGSE